MTFIQIAWSIKLFNELSENDFWIYYICVAEIDHNERQTFRLLYINIKNCFRNFNVWGTDIEYTDVKISQQHQEQIIAIV